VNVYRLITKGSIEEKIYQRAQKKLYLDAVVIQQGKLIEENKSLSTSELLSMITFGAEEIFRNDEGTTLSDEDLELILKRGEKKVEEIDNKLKNQSQTNLLTFSLTGDASLYEFEGLDYSQKPTLSIAIEEINEDFVLLDHIDEEVDKNIDETVYSVEKKTMIIFFTAKKYAIKALELLNSKSTSNE
jgi:hypothetical protein